MAEGIRLALPKGSMYSETLALFAAASLDISGDEDNAFIGDRRIREVRFLRAQDIAYYVGREFFDLGITGLDWIVENSQSPVIQLADLQYGRVRIVCIAREDSDIKSRDDIRRAAESRCVSVVSEYAGNRWNSIARTYIEGLKLPVRRLEDEGDQSLPDNYLPSWGLYRSYGATEQIVGAGLADIGIDNVATGKTLAKVRPGLCIIDEVPVTDKEKYSTARLISNKAALKEKQDAIDEIKMLLEGARDGKGMVMLEMNVPGEALDRVTKVLPSMKGPTTSPLYGTGEPWFAMKVAAKREEAKYLIPNLKRAGACDILEYPITKLFR